MRELTSKQTARFWSKIRTGEPDDCWEWQACVHRQGYGEVGFHGKLYLAHRVAWALHNGDVPVGMMVCHTCDNPPCCNPKHLFLGTQTDNMLDMQRKNRANHPKGDNTGGRIASNLNWEIVEKIRALHASGAFTYRALGKMFSVSGTTAHRIVNNHL